MDAGNARLCLVLALVTWSAGSFADPEPAAEVGTPEDSEPVEIVVLGERPAPARRSMTRAEVRELPGAFGDPFRALESFPGVTPTATGYPFFFVRGAPPGNVGYFIDGIRVPLLYHLGLGPSVVHPGLVSRVDLHSGGYPAEYGRFAGGIVTAETTPPNPELHGEGNLRVIDSGALLESGFAQGRGTALAGGRYSYTGLLLSLLAPEVQLAYWDYQARVSYDVSERDTLGLFAFGSYDFLSEREGDATDIKFDTQFHRVDLRWLRRFSARTDSQVAVTTGFDRTRIGNADFVSNRMLSGRMRVRHQVDSTALLRAGLDTSFDSFALDRSARSVADEEGDVRALLRTRVDSAFGVWSDLPWQATPRVRFTPGARVDLYRSRGAVAVAVEPRASAEFTLTESLRLIHAAGVAHQAPAFPLPVPGYQLSDLEGGLQRSLQHSAGLELELPHAYSASVTLFQSASFDMTDYFGTGADSDQTEDVVEGDPNQDGNGTEPPEPALVGGDAERLLDRSIGHSFGVELMLRRALTRRFGTLVTYTLSRSTRSFAREGLVSAFDRTHVLNTAAAYDLGKRWRAGARFVFYTGRPRYVTSAEGDLRSRGRLPHFFRVDLRLEKRWPLGRSGSWALVLEVLNASARKEVLSEECSERGCKSDVVGPVTIPSIGVEAFF